MCRKANLNLQKMCLLYEMEESSLFKKSTVTIEFINIQQLASVAQLDARRTGDWDVAGSTPPGRQHSFTETDHEIFFTITLSLLLIQEEQLSVSGKTMYKIWVNHSEE